VNAAPITANAATLDAAVHDTAGGRLWAQGPVSEAAALAAAVAPDGLGTVLTLASNTVKRTAALKRGAAAARAASPLGRLMADASRYSGKNRRLASEPFDPDWLALQRDLGMAQVLTDSGYVDDGDHAGLENLLGRAARLPAGTVCVLPLAQSWLLRDADAAVAAVDRHAVPVALVLEHAKDPLAKPEAVRGLLRLLACAPPVTLLRSDVSALGALVHGADGAAVGTDSGLRHLFPVTKGGGGGHAPRVSAVVPALLGYFTLARIEDAHTADPDLDVWRCPCWMCADRSVTWLSDSGDPAGNAYRHSLAALARIAGGLLNPALTGAEQQTSWREQCQHAQSFHMDIHGTLGDDWEPKKALAAWVKAGGALVG
jgi:hypothetical protein